MYYSRAYDILELNLLSVTIAIATAGVPGQILAPNIQEAPPPFDYDKRKAAARGSGEKQSDDTGE